MRALVALDKIEISVDLSAGNAKGEIIEAVWKGDHYRYIIRTEEEEDYILDSTYSWNEKDLVSVIIKADDIVLKLKKDLSEYEIKE